MSGNQQDGGYPPWATRSDLYASRWATPPPATSFKETLSKLDHTEKTGTDPGLTNFGLSRGLEASRWADPRVPTPLTPKEMGLIPRAPAPSHHPLSYSQGLHGYSGGVVVSNGRPTLTLDTRAQAVGKSRIDDARDVVMGENTPISPMSPGFSALRDADGDIAMQDLDDPSVPSQITQVLEGERSGMIRPRGRNTDVDPSTRPLVVEWVLVLDTSFILSHLHLVNNLVEAYHRWGNVVMLPWATIMELDGLKKSTSAIRHKNAHGVEETVSVGMLARRANNWCFEMMAKRAKGLWGQMAEEVFDPSSAKGDAAILDCCRYVKEKKGINTALLSNDKNLCVKALVYQIKAITFRGTPFTADGIMSSLEGEKSGEISYLPPGIWSKPEDADKPIDETKKAPYYARAPNTDNKNLGLYASRHAVPSFSGFRSNAGARSYNPRHSEPENRTNPNSYRQDNSWKVRARGETIIAQDGVAIKPTSEEEVRASLGLLLLRIEEDLNLHLRPLLHAFWVAHPNPENSIDPLTVSGFEGIESATWECLKPHFEELFPGLVALHEMLSGMEFSRCWNNWGLWAAPDIANSGSSTRPNERHLREFIGCWEILWNGMLKFSTEQTASHHHLIAVGTWKLLVSGLSPHLSGDTT